MEDELRKRNTDCVYFLASPLTCKKGYECEYRHSEIVRLNPIDCRYWLAGNCFNPACGFRHPPLDGQSSQSATLKSKAVNKTNIPCYFFVNGICNKGEMCPFLHGPDSGNSVLKSLKTVPLSVKKPPVPTEYQALPKTVTKLHDQLNNKSFQHSSPDNVLGQSVSPQKSSSECDGAVSEYSLPAEVIIQNVSLGYHAFADESSKDLVNDHTAPDDQVDDQSEFVEKWISSPEIDIIVNDRLDCYEDDDNTEYTLVDHVEVDAHLLLDGYEDTYQTDDFNDDYILKYVDELSGQSKERVLSPRMSRKRKVMVRELPVIGCTTDMDLRDCLRKRRMIDDYLVNGSRKRHISSRLSRSRDIPRRHDQHRDLPRCHSQQHHGRMRNSEYHSSKGRSTRPSQMKESTRHNISRKKLVKERVPSSRISRRTRSAQNSITFSGPKTLSQIKEEKTNIVENGGFLGKMEHKRRNSWEDFQGPKSLSEILKDKKIQSYAS